MMRNHVAAWTMRRRVILQASASTVLCIVLAGAFSLADSEVAPKQDRGGASLMERYLCGSVSEAKEAIEEALLELRQEPPESVESGSRTAHAYVIWHFWGYIAEMADGDEGAAYASFARARYWGLRSRPRSESVERTAEILRRFTEDELKRRALRLVAAPQKLLSLLPAEERVSEECREALAGGVGPLFARRAGLYESERDAGQASDQDGQGREP